MRACSRPMRLLRSYGPTPGRFPWASIPGSKASSSTAGPRSRLSWASCSTICGYAAENYKVHAVEDQGHGGRQIDALRDFATSEEWQARIMHAVKLGLTAFTLEWDGHVQAMTGRREWWPGVARLELRLPEVRFRS